MYHDEFCNLYRTQARWYEPREGLMLSPDPMLTGSPGATVVEPRLLGAYTYSFDNPARFVDRSGKAPLEALTSFINGDIPVPFGVERTMAWRTDFETSHPKFAKWFGTGVDANKTKGRFTKVTEFLDERCTPSRSGSSRKASSSSGWAFQECPSSIAPGRSSPRICSEAPHGDLRPWRPLDRA